MQALLLGSIGTLADTSELQRQAFNEAFAAHGLDWNWSQDAYRHMLREAGGARRIRAQAEAEGREVDADAVHASKSERFQRMLDDGKARSRPGIPDLIEQARRDGVRVGLVTTTEARNVDRLLAGLNLSRDGFDVIVTREDVSEPKPDGECYRQAASRLDVPPAACLAIEDNSDGVRAALEAGMACVAWPNENTRGHDFTGAHMAGDDIGAAVGAVRTAAE